MNIRLPIIALIGAAVFLIASNLPAQDDETAPPPASDSEENSTEEPEIRAGQEVEINEDNYRQFMELKDPNLQRQVIPETVYKPGSGLQKLDDLPEESQKHLRNQLREIIVQGDPWQPGDEETEYPYTPSEAAGNNPALEKEELEAWGELVDSYHDRESQIYENSSGSQAARGSEQGSSNSQQNGQGSPDGSGEEGEGSEGQQAGQEGNQNQSETEGTYSVNGSGNPDANSTAGVSQNAMEFLQGLGKGGGNRGQGNQGDSTEGDGPGGNSPTPSEAQSQTQAGQQGGSGQDTAENSETPGSTGDPNANSTAGSSQNAMEFLQGLGRGAGNPGEGDAEATSEGVDQGTALSPSEGQAYGQSNSPGGTEQGSGQTPDSESTAGSSQNAMEFLKSMSAQGDAQNGSSTNASDSSEGQFEGSQDNQAAAQASGQHAVQEQGQENAQADSQQASQDNGQGETPGNEKAGSQNEDQSQNSQQAETEKKSSLAEPPSITPADSPNEAEEESTAGAAQNALEYLTGDNAQSREEPDNKEETGQTEGTLTIQDLLNAQGVGAGNTKPADEKQVDETKPEKDGE